MKHQYRDMTWPEVNEAVEGNKVVVIPVGAIEQHGPHLPIDTDNLAVEHIAEEAARRASDTILCAPIIHYGFNEHNMDFPGTISIEIETLTEFAVQVGHSFARQGFRRIIYLNGHGSNSPVYDLVARRLTNQGNALAASIDWWMLAWPTVQQVCEGYPESVDHACEWETSVYKHLRPELVDDAAIRDEVAAEKGGPSWLYPNLAGGVRVHFMNAWSRMSTSGVNGRPSLATAGKGKAIVDAAIDTLVTVARDFRDMPLHPRTVFTRAVPRP